MIPLDFGQRLFDDAERLKFCTVSVSFGVFLSLFFVFMVIDAVISHPQALETC